MFKSNLIRSLGLISIVFVFTTLTNGVFFKAGELVLKIKSGDRSMVTSDPFEKLSIIWYLYWSVFKQYFIYFAFLLMLLNRQSLSQGLLFPWNVFNFVLDLFFLSFFYCFMKTNLKTKRMALCVLGILLSVSTQMHWIAFTASHEMPFDPCLL